jgi:hypothetical protein
LAPHLRKAAGLFRFLAVILRQTPQNGLMMAKGEQRSNRETKKPKAAKPANLAAATAINSARAAAALMTRGTVDTGVKRKSR